MNIPAFTSPTLCIGRTYDAENSTAARDLFPADIPTKLIHVNKLSFKYKVVKNSKDVNDLFDVSGELSLKIKANLLKVEGAGRYINETKKKEGTTTLLAVMKCTTVTETIDGDVEPLGNLLGTGTHYVRSVTYGAELVAKLQFTSSGTETKENIGGRIEGDIPVQGASAGLKAKLNSFTSECNSASDLQVDYYDTGLPDKLPTNIEDLIRMIEEFPSRLRDINDGKGVPITFELLPVKYVVPDARDYLKERVQNYLLEQLEDRFDDLRSALDLANEFMKRSSGSHEDVKEFISDCQKVKQEFLKAISNLGKQGEMKEVEASLNAYNVALDGFNFDGKFVRRWMEIQSSKEEISETKKGAVSIPDPVALYPLNGQYGTRAIANRQPRGNPVGVTLAAGPNGKAGGSYQFTGQANSYIEFPNNGGLDTERSITMLCWLYPQNTDGPIFSYKTSGSWGVHMWVVSGELFGRCADRNYQLQRGLVTSKSLKHNQWQYVGASYDHNTGVESLWLDGRQVEQTNIGAGLTLGTQDDVRMGAKEGDGRYFRGRIAAMQIYDVALTEEQVKAVKNAGQESGP